MLLTKGKEGVESISIYSEIFPNANAKIVRMDALSITATSMVGIFVFQKENSLYFSNGAIVSFHERADVERAFKKIDEISRQR